MKLLLLFFSFLFCYVQADDLMTRNYYMPLAAAAYANDPNSCLSNIQKYWHKLDNETVKPKLYRQYTFNCSSLNDTCSGFIAIDVFSKSIFIAFKGTTNFEQFYHQNWNYDDMVPFVSGGKVSKQIFDAFNGIWINAGMKDDILTLKNKYLEWEFIVVGHSVGGAMATLAAATIVSTKIVASDYLSLYTFGQPRIGDKVFANGVDSVMIFTIPIRTIHNADIVPHLPSFNQSIYYHNAAELWYPNDMQDGDIYMECRFAGEDQKCSDSLANSKLNFNDHKTYFGRNIVDYGINGCPDLAKLK